MTDTLNRFSPATKISFEIEVGHKIYMTPSYLKKKEEEEVGIQCDSDGLIPLNLSQEREPKM